MNGQENSVYQRRPVTENFQKRFYSAERRTTFRLRQLSDRLLLTDGDRKNTPDAKRNMVRNRAFRTAVSSHFSLGKCSGTLPDRARGRRGNRRRYQRRVQFYQPVHHQRNKVRLAENPHFRVHARRYVFDLLSDRTGNTFRLCLNNPIFVL